MNFDISMCLRFNISGLLSLVQWKYTVIHRSKRIKHDPLSSKSLRSLFNFRLQVPQVRSDLIYARIALRSILAEKVLLTSRPNFNIGFPNMSCYDHFDWIFIYPVSSDFAPRKYVFNTACGCPVFLIPTVSVSGVSNGKSWV
mmetsp:Transcript_5440/g.7872  ORF Transcript_5440/g.7872 Transcript_5440/m.7872 type:complete len:142 (+) Transcript_5440:1365-1790(+)